MEFWKLFVVALMPTVKVLLMTVLGTFLALDRFDILRKESSRKKLNTIVFFVFSPALVCGRLAETITPQSLLTLWFLPLNVLLTFTIGAALGLLLVKIIRVPHHLHGLILGCCAAGNLGNLPLIILPAVCKQKSKPFGDADICQKNALGYISLSMAIGSICFWTIVYKLVSISSGQISNEVKVDDSMITPNSTLEINQENISKDTSHTNHVKQLEIECTTTSIERVKVPEKEKIMEHIKVLVEKINLKALFKPETIGAIIGLIIGIVPIFRKLLIVNNAPLAVIEDTIVMVGDAAIPIMTLLVGANLVKGLKGPGKQFPVIVGIIVARFIALPLIGIGIVKGAIHFGLIHPDPLYQFVLLLQFALPPAVSMSTITQLFGVSEGECSVIMLATYSCAAFSLTLWSTFFMWLVL
ncbi:protein PIN-LIKES 3-like [Vicia villosa]|uniref:protein PIN-LIKES 3-like n=1 Tax=Vicia villosa TaxID=3911 RepID=UPI00273BB4EA|nr:protein PIN-LIKES 3-like [Vicia villosa]